MTILPISVLSAYPSLSMNLICTSAWPSFSPSVSSCVKEKATVLFVPSLSTVISSPVFVISFSPCSIVRYTVLSVRSRPLTVMMKSGVVPRMKSGAYANSITALLYQSPTAIHVSPNVWLLFPAFIRAYLNPVVVMSQHFTLHAPSP